MSRRLKLALAILVLLALLAALVVVLLSRVDAKSRFEAVVSEATGLEVAVNGNVSIGLFPSPHVALKEVTLKNRESQIASLGEAAIGVALWPLLRRQVRIKRLMLRNVSVSVERDRNGHFNFAKPSQASRPVPAMSLGRLSSPYRSATSIYSPGASSRPPIAVSMAATCNRPREAAWHHEAPGAYAWCVRVRNSSFVGADVDFRLQETFTFTVTMHIMAQGLESSTRILPVRYLVPGSLCRGSRT
jgi:hypothetical protein